MSLWVVIFTLLYISPLLKSSDIYLHHNNDLENFFYPFWYYFQQNISRGIIPLWNYISLSGIPFYADPQSPIFYPINVLLLLLDLSINNVFLIHLIFHLFVATLGTYILCKNGLKLSKQASLIGALFFLTSPLLAGYIEAGHVGLIAAYAWLPFTFFLNMKIAQTPKKIYIVSFALTLSFIFANHTLAFAIALLSNMTITAYLIFIHRQVLLNQSLRFLITYCFALGFISMALIPQLHLLPDTTRNLLITKPELYPQWNGKKEFVSAILSPFFLNNSIAADKRISIGLIPFLVGMLGLLRLKKNLKFVTGAILLSLIIFAGANLLPNFLYKELLEIPVITSLRVFTRTWFVMSLIFSLLIANFLNFINGKKIYLIGILILIENILISWSYVIPKVTPNTQNPVPNQIYEIIAQDSDIFRVYCTTRCISQKEANNRNLQLVDGYNTIQLTRYYKQAWQLTGAYWDYYTLSIPPYGSFTVDKPTPDFNSLGLYNTKYILSPYKIATPGAELVYQYDQYYLYLNKLFKPRSYLVDEANEFQQSIPISMYTANTILINTNIQRNSNKLVLADVYSKGWYAYLNGKEKISVEETPIALRLIPLKNDTQFVIVDYAPPGQKLGLIISGITYLLALIFLIID